MPRLSGDWQVEFLSGRISRRKFCSGRISRRKLCSGIFSRRNFYETRIKSACSERKKTSTLSDPLTRDGCVDEWGSVQSGYNMSEAFVWL